MPVVGAFARVETEPPDAVRQRLAELEGVETFGLDDPGKIGLIIEGTPAPPQEETVSQFNANAFPPMIPASGSHRTAWIKDDCLLCHETGNSSAPIVVHEGLPEILFAAKCRSCHVQIRSDEASRAW